MTLGGRWALYRFAAESLTRRQWNAAVSPYFHLLDPTGRVVAKGVGSRPEHLDHLLSITPAELGDADYTPISDVWTDLDAADEKASSRPCPRSVIASPSASAGP